MNENGQHLLEFCCYYGLCVSNTFFNTKLQHRVSWRHPRSKHWHQLDLILTRCSSLPNIMITRSYQSADCDTDHSLVCSRVKLRTKRLYYTKKEGRPRIDISKTRNQRKVKEFAQALEETLPGPANVNASERWEHFKNAVYNTALSTFGKKTKKMADWFEAHSEELMPAIEDKRRALAVYKACPSEYNLQALRAARSKVQQAARRCSNDYWLQLCSQIQIAAGTGNIKGMYDGIKQALGTMQKKSAPLKSATGVVIQDRAQQMERWVQHYSELYSRENVVTEEALNNIECLPVLEELDSEPTLAEIKAVFDSLASGKAPGRDNIPVEVLKCGKEIIITELYEVFCLCWREGGVPQDMKDANIVTLYKNKGRTILKGCSYLCLALRSARQHGMSSLSLPASLPLPMIYQYPVSLKIRPNVKISPSMIFQDACNISPIQKISPS
uniref:Craniofacial development protein 2-like n=1 Tax=Pogona vitticeps TaxID=103695 RepID=A0ABM5FP43_9SAUR